MRVHHALVRRLVPIVVTLAAGAFLAASPAAAEDGGRPLTATLTGGVEVPLGDPDAFGTAELRVNVGQERICYTLTVDGVDGVVTAAHIHKAPVGVAGPIVVPLVAPVGGTSSACADVDRNLAKAILQDPSAYYVNVHSTVFPPGAVRGQLQI